MTWAPRSAGGVRGAGRDHGERQRPSGSRTRSSSHSARGRPGARAPAAAGLVAHERERDGRLPAREDDVQGLDAEPSASALSVIHGADGLADPLAVAQREHGDHEAAR